MFIVNNKPVGTKAANHVVTIDYKTWGLANRRPDIIRLVNETKEVSGEDFMKYIAKLEQLADLDGYNIVSKKHVQHYCGEDYAAPTLLWLRLEREDQINNGIGGEHISATFNINDGKLMGMVRMFADADNSDFISHQQALETAINFLRDNASDLISKKVVIPQLTKLDNGSRIEFDQEDKLLKLDKVQIYWIGGHKELISINGQPKEVHGMKVKMYVPEQKLYVWVVVDKNNNVLIFERSVSWDFVKFQRNTQMWLHDPWLVAHGIY